MHALARWAVTGGHPPVIVATVDHGLRAESALEAEAVASSAAQLGLRHHRLAWCGDKPKAGLQDAARAARYRLLSELALRQGADYLVTAHTLDDQAETVMMRLARGSGLAGLGGMRRETETHGLVHVRPFLHLPKAALVDACRDQGWSFCEDPSNADPRFARSRWRKILPLLAAEGLDASCLARVAERAQRADEALAAQSREAMARVMLGQEVGVTRLDGRALACEPFEIAVRVLAVVLGGTRRPGESAIRLQRLEECTRVLCEASRAGQAARRTIGGKLVAIARSGVVTIAPEGPRRRGRPSLGNHPAAAPPHSLGKGGMRT
jgi:tRNA(Ile)-lysidine synthase